MNLWREYRRDFEQDMALALAAGMDEAEAKAAAKRAERAFHRSKRTFHEGRLPENYEDFTTPEYRDYMIPGRELLADEYRDATRAVLVVILLCPLDYLHRSLGRPKSVLCRYKNQIRELLGLPAEVGRQLPIRFP